MISAVRLTQKSFGIACGCTFASVRRNGKRRELFDAQDAIDQQWEDLIGMIEKPLKHTSELRTRFTVRWRVA